MTAPTRPSPDAGERKAPAKVRRTSRGGARWLRELVILVVLVLAFSALVRTFLLQAFSIPSGSMEETLVPGDRVVVSKLTPEVFSIKRGDVVVFRDPGGWLPPPPKSAAGPVDRGIREALVFVGLLPDDANEYLIKRVIGLPGDHVQCTASGVLEVNGRALSEPYVDSPNSCSGVNGIMPFSITVPPGDMWVMGDHRDASGDSRFHDKNSQGVDTHGRAGSVSESLVVGRAVAVVWPPSRWSTLSNYHSVFGAVPASSAR